jgi:hypothetical protein
MGRISARAAFVLFALFLSDTVHAQTSVPVVLVLKKGGSSEAVLVGKTDNGLRLQPKGATAGEYQISFDQVTEIRFVFPETLGQIQEALNRNQWDRAAAMMKPVAAPLLFYLDLPANNGVAFVMVLADSLRRANKPEEALSYYDRLRMLPRSPESMRAAIWTAHCHVALNRADAAWKILQSMEPPKRDSDLFPLYQLVRAQVRQGQKDFVAALDEIAQGIAFSRMESESYPESLFLAAQCYETLAATNAANTGLIFKTIPSTNRVVAAAAVTTNVTLSLTANSNYVAVAQGMYQEIVTRFPETIFAQRSQSKLPPPVATQTNKPTAN